MSESIAIRHATAGDNVLLADIGAETFADAFGVDNTDDDMRQYLESAFGPDIQAAELADRANVFLIAEVHGLPAGYARLREATHPAAATVARPIELVRLYARTPWIGRGVGAALMKASLSEAQARGCDLVWLGVWERNERAIAFYRSWGFLERGNQTFLLGSDLQHDLVMTRPVPQPAGDALGAPASR